MLVTLRFSVSPGIPGRIQQIPRTIRSISTPARDASATLCMKSISVTEFIFIRIRPPLPFAISSSISSRTFCFKLDGETIRWRYVPFRLAMDMFLKNTAASSPISWSPVSSEKSVYIFAVFSL